MIKRNPNMKKLNAGYLFPEIAKRKKLFITQNPEAQLISLGIGDTTEPIPFSITEGLSTASQALGTKQGYSGYGAEQGNPLLRQKIADKIYHQKVESTEVFVSDGAKCDLGRLQVLFGSDATIAVQDPVYPVYVDTAVILGMTGSYDSNQCRYQHIHYMPCLPENDFFPELDKMPRTDILFFCSPNNPTGAAATYTQLERLVNYAHTHQSLIVYDAAYAIYISNAECPKSIYEIDGAKQVAIELSSFSKMSGFTGVRLGWAVVPHALKYEDGFAINQDWNRICQTFFNGASNIAQAGGIASLDEEGWAGTQEMVAFYMQNARMIKKVFTDFGFEVYGGTEAPYIWVKFPNRTSWEAFEEILTHAHIVTIPGSGFGACGEGFLRISAFGHRENILAAVQRLRQYFERSRGKHVE